MRYLVTGCAGFIGFHVAKRLLESGHDVMGIDNMNSYYNSNLKRDRIGILNRLKNSGCFISHSIDFAGPYNLASIHNFRNVDKICHLGAQAGVRYSLENPYIYMHSNIQGTLNVFELARQAEISDVIYASSSSVYGKNTKLPFSEKDKIDKPISLYAMTKITNELMSYTYNHLYGLNMTGLRFFTVYGPWGRPDMALFKFTKAILEGKPIDVYNYGEMKRSFTYIDDIVDGVIAALDKSYPYEIFNLGSSKTDNLLYFIECIEKAVGKKAIKNLLPIQHGDVPETFADIGYSKEKLGFEPKVEIEEGVNNFVSWYREWVT